MANITEQIKSLYGQIKCLRDDVAACCGVLSTGLERLDDGLGDTWRLVDKDPTLYNGGFNAIEFGLNAVAPLSPSGEISFNIGYDNKPLGFGAFVTGIENRAEGSYGVVFGEFNDSYGYASLIQGYLNQTSAPYTIAYGQENVVQGWYGYASGQDNFVDNRHARAYGEYKQWHTNGNLKFDADEAIIKKYDRKELTRQLTDIFNEATIGQ